MTPLIQAVDYEDYEILELLFAHGADINVASPHNGATPLHWAVSWVEDSYQIDLQDNNYADSVCPDYTMIKYLLKRHPNLDIKDNVGQRVEDVFPNWQELRDLFDEERKWQTENGYL